MPLKPWSWISLCLLSSDCNLQRLQFCQAWEVPRSQPRQQSLQWQENQSSHSEHKEHIGHKKTLIYKTIYCNWLLAITVLRNEKWVIVKMDVTTATNITKGKMNSVLLTNLRLSCPPHRLLSFTVVTHHQTNSYATLWLTGTMYEPQGWEKRHPKLLHSSSMTIKYVRMLTLEVLGLHTSRIT